MNVDDILRRMSALGAGSEGTLSAWFRGWVDGAVQNRVARPDAKLDRDAYDRGFSDGHAAYIDASEREFNRTRYDIVRLLSGVQKSATKTPRARKAAPKKRNVKK